MAVFAEPDSDAAFVGDADEAICIGPAALDRSYLDIAAILAAAATTSADAIHPGYGFLSENAGFARAVVGAGLTWIGPHPDAIAQMGAKIEARSIAERAGVPTIPGASEGDLAAAAAKIGFPVLVKASAGGGGKGIRIVRSPAEFDAAIVEARTEAQRSFGDDRVIVERYIERPRHVEVQVVGDRHGNLIHLGTRDCSSQRRYQKLLEEAPAANLSTATRDGLHEAAVSLAHQISYDNAGTVEFIVDAHNGEFFFLEMNTRLQVEHPVTEAICGLDLVELQLRSATGERLGLAQSEVSFSGHSIEARINAEDPADGFSPRAGSVTHLVVPPGVRWDSAVRARSDVSPYYDPLVAKLIVHRPDRAAALEALRDSLDGLVLGPVPTNAGFLRWLSDTSQLRDGTMTTNVIDALAPHEMPPVPSAASAAVPAATAWLNRRRNERAAHDVGPWTSLGSFRLTEHCSDAAVLLRDASGELHEVAAATINRPGVPITSHQPDRVVTAATECSAAANIDGHTVSFEVPDRSDAWAPSATTDVGSGGDIAAPFPAVVVEVCAAAGDTVASGDAVVVVEAMKMLHSLAAHGAGVVSEIRCSPGDAVEANQILVTFAHD